MKNEKIYQTNFGEPSEALSLVSETLSPCPAGLVQVPLEARTINPSDILSVFGEGQYRFNHVPPRVPVSKVFALADYSSAIEFAMQKNRTPSGKVILA